MPKGKKSYGILDEHNGRRPGESTTQWMLRNIESLPIERRPLPAYVDNRQHSPCHNQTKEEIEDWLRANVKIGTKVAVRTTGNTLIYFIVPVAHLNKRSFVVGSFGAFYYSGKNCTHPGGQTRLIIPTEAVREFIKRHPQGAFSLGKDGYQVGFY